MIILITGASHTGKTALAQKLLEKYKYPYLSIDHLKMGLIRSKNTELTPSSDDSKMTEYLWPIVREMIKTAIENHQNLIVEGCYIPFDWKDSFEISYLNNIKYYCLVLSENYIRNNFCKIKEYANVIEQRLEDDCSLESVIEDNKYFLEKAVKYNLNYILVEDSYDIKVDDTIDYYNNHAEEFYNGTVNVEFTSMQDKFLEKIEVGSYILDFGCGSGRDTKYFLEKGYEVDAIDGSEALCKLASEFTGIKVKNMFFQNLSEVCKYDGIWACSSILHLPANELLDVLRRMTVALKPHGIIYTSFKYGTFSGERNGRFFTDMTENTFAEILGEIDNLGIEELWITSDARPGRDEEKWLNLILRKSGS